MLYNNNTNGNLTILNGNLTIFHFPDVDKDADEYISQKNFKIVMFVFPLMVTPLFCLLGCIGNILCLVVLSKKCMRNQTNNILKALCVSDTLFLIISLIYTLLNVYRKLDPIDGEALRSRVYRFVGAYGSIVFARITSGLTTLLCAERFIAVYFPMQARVICTVRSTRIAIFIIFITTALVFVPFIFKYEPVTFQDSENVTRTIMNKTEFYQNNIKFYRIYGTILNILFRFAPLVIIPILNVLMIRAVHQTWQRRTSSTNGSPASLRCSSRSNKHTSSAEQNHITIMLITVSFVFFICILPGALNSLATHVWTYYSPMGKARNMYICISSGTFLLETINSSVNFIIYMALSRKFRLLFKDQFCCGHGQYYLKISASLKEKFRWSTSRKHSKHRDSDSYGRKTVSDIGPLIHKGSASRKDHQLSTEIHSEGCEFGNGSCDKYEIHSSRPSCVRPHGYRSGHHYLKHLHKKSICDLIRSRTKTSKGTLTVENRSRDLFTCSTAVCLQQNGHLSNATDV